MFVCFPQSRCNTISSCTPITAALLRKVVLAPNLPGVVVAFLLDIEVVVLVVLLSGEDVVAILLPALPLLLPVVPVLLVTLLTGLAKLYLRIELENNILKI